MEFGENCFTTETQRRRGKKAAKGGAAPVVGFSNRRRMSRKAAASCVIRRRGFTGMRKFLILLTCFAAAGFALDPPTALTVVTATNKQVKLSWTAGGTAATQYVVERRTLDSTTY